MSRRRFLPDDVTATLEAIGSNLLNRRKIRPIPGLKNLFDKIDAAHLARAEVAIVELAALYHWRRKPTIMARLFSSVPTDIDQLNDVDGLEVVFIFHRDGRIREAALNKISRPLSSAFLFAAIARRLNDWAEPVRQAAYACAERTFPDTVPEVVADAAVFLLMQQVTWRRWGTERAVLDQAFARADVNEALARRVISNTDGPMASLLRHAMRFDGMDNFLERIEGEAKQPATRAVSFQSLIAGYAEWPIGRSWRWVDKSMGVRRRETVFARRAITVSPDTLGLIRRGLKDRAAAVRKQAASGLIARYTEFEDAQSLATDLLADRSAAVRDRAKFLLGLIANP